MKLKILKPIDRIPEQPGLYDRTSEVNTYDNEMKGGMTGFIQSRFVDDVIAKYGHHRKLRVLDLGTGPGFIAVKIAQRRPEWEVVGLDGSKLMLEKARANAAHVGVRVDWVTSLADQIPFESQSFDLVVSHFAFSEFPDGKAVLKDIKRVLRPGGFLVIQDLVRPPSWQMPMLMAWRYLSNPFGGINKQYRASLRGAHTEAELNQMFEGTGFSFGLKVFMKWGGGIARVWAQKPGMGSESSPNLVASPSHGMRAAQI